MSFHDHFDDVSGRRDLSGSSAFTSAMPSSSCPLSGERQTFSNYHARDVNRWQKRALLEPVTSPRGKRETLEDPLQVSHSAPELLQGHSDSSMSEASKRDARRLAKNRATAAVSRARKRAHVEELQAKVAVQEHANAILRHKLAERDAEIQGLLTQTDAPQQGTRSGGESTPLIFGQRSLFSDIGAAHHNETRPTGHLPGPRPHGTSLDPSNPALPPAVQGIASMSCLPSPPLHSDHTLQLGHQPSVMTGQQSPLRLAPAVVQQPPLGNTVTSGEPDSPSELQGNSEGKQSPPISTVQHQLESRTAVIYTREMQTQPRASGLTLPDPPHSDLPTALEYAISEQEGISISPQHRQPLDLSQPPLKSSGRRLLSTDILQHAQSDPGFLADAPTSQKEDWEDDTRQEYCRQQILLQQQQLMRNSRQPAQQQQQQQQQQHQAKQQQAGSSSTLSAMMYSTDSHGWSLDSCKGEDMMMGFAPDCHEPDPAWWLDAAMNPPPDSLVATEQSESADGTGQSNQCAHGDDFSWYRA